MRLHSYVVARDYGFAPNPFHGACTLSACKPVIRRVAQVGDWILGTGSKRRGRQGRAVFIMQVSEAMTFDQYWSDPRFTRKRPSLFRSLADAFGDNIYHRDPVTGAWVQENSHHSLPDGTPNGRNIARDTQTDRVLVAENYVYWGGSGPAIPEQFRNYNGFDICAGRGHVSRFPADLLSDFAAWIGGMAETGYVGSPLDW